MPLQDNIYEQEEWWKDEAFLADLEKNYNDWDSGKEKGYSFADIRNEIFKKSSERENLKAIKESF